MDRSRAHLAIVTHLPGRDWWWLGLRRRCTFCGQRYPCPPRRQAIDVLASPYESGSGGRGART